MISTNKDKIINREISWLNFNERVLQEAKDTSNPLIERLRFLGIFSNNLDEFFRVRVGTLNRLINLKITNENYKFNPSEILKQINKINNSFQKEFNKTYDEIKQELEKEDICIINEKQINNKEHVDFVKKYFSQKIRSKIFPLMLDQLIENVLLIDDSIFLAILMKSKHKKIKNNYAMIKIPASIPRFVILPELDGKKYIILIDDVIRYCISDIFSMFDYNNYEAYTVKFTKNAELDIDKDISKSFIQIISKSIEQRKIGQTVRFIYDEEMPECLLDILLKRFNISKNDSILKGSRYHNFRDFIDFPDFCNEKLINKYNPPINHRELANAKSIFTVLNKKDIMLTFPYHSFQHVIDLLREASIDPQVTSIKITIYRVAKDSSIINALINAARNGKDVTAFVELQARFDEKANIKWSEKLHEEGVRIIHGISNLKVHSKLILIKRTDNQNKETSYAYIGTGNFNEDTAKTFADNCLLTSDKKVTSEVDKVFELIEIPHKQVRFQKLIVSPFSQRNFFIKKINQEINNVKKGKKGLIIAKLNNLVDETIIKKLYQANNVGVKIKLIIRGICVLIPSKKGLSENIEAISIVDKYLEHARVLYFYNDGNEEYYISSADWMARNFDNRIEVSCQIYDKNIQKELKKMLDLQLKDNTKSRLLNIDKMNTYKDPNSTIKHRAQIDFYNYIRKIH